MAIESNIFQWIGGSIDMTLNTFVQVTSSNVISDFTDVFVYGGILTFTLMGFAIILGYVQSPAANFVKTAGKFVLISGLALSSPTYMGWVVEALRGLETGVADAFSATGSTTAATSVYQVLDQAVTDGFKIGADMLSKMGKRSWYEAGMMFWDLLNALIIYGATLLIAIPAGAMVIVSKVMLTIMLGIGPFFIAMLMFGQVTAKWFDSWFGQVMTYILQIALVTTVLSMGVKFFGALTAEVLAVTDDHPIATFLEILILSAVVFYLLQKAFEVGAFLAGGVSSAGITLRQALAPMRPINPLAQSTRLDPRTGHQTTGSRAEHFMMGRTVWNPAYQQAVQERMRSGWARADGGNVKKG
ncbi:type IV secretion system protein [Vibrio cholerae]